MFSVLLEQRPRGQVFWGVLSCASVIERMQFFQFFRKSRSLSHQENQFFIAHGPHVKILCRYKYSPLVKGLLNYLLGHHPTHLTFCLLLVH